MGINWKPIPQLSNNALKLSLCFNYNGKMTLSMTQVTYPQAFLLVKRNYFPWKLVVLTTNSYLTGNYPISFIFHILEGSLGK